VSERRFTEKPDLNPMGVISLAIDHAAMRENRTLFPSTVVTVTESEPARILVSGKNNRKIGSTVEKGKFKGYGIYCLSLEERATCPEDCSARGICYGNGMQMARRHRIGDPDIFFDRLGFEIAELLDDHPGLLIRLHVLGDFPSVEYVSFWKEVLDENPNVACFGYTHRNATAWGGDEIGDAIQAVKDVHPERFRIRWSTDVSRPDSAVILDHVPRGARGPNQEIVCPAQRDATACCATCSLCWEARSENIAFIKHGRPSIETEAASVMAKMNTPAPRVIEDVSQPEQSPGHRAIVPIPINGLSPSSIRVARPTFVDADPRKLIVETKYQRDLSGKSLNLIKRIIERFDWSKFNPPVCVECPDGYFVIDGQHTAIGAASHPDLTTIPIMVVDAASVEARAASFVSHNRDRVAMTAAQVFYGEVSAGDAEAMAIRSAVDASGAHIPRNPVPKQYSKIGQIVAIGRIQRFYRSHGAEKLTEVLSICTKGRCKPISGNIFEAVCGICTEPQYSDVNREDLITALMAQPNFDQAVIRLAADLNSSRFHAARVLLYRAASNLSSGRKAA
jgi:hypothetical protein